MMDAASKKVGAGDLMVFLAKQIEQFGRQWNAGYIDKRRFRKGFRAAKEMAKEEEELELQQQQQQQQQQLNNNSKYAPTRPEGYKRPGNRPANGRLVMEPVGPHHDRAATKLQAIQRGRFARTHGWRKQESAKELQRHYRGYLTRKQTKRKHNGATRLQALQRGKSSRRKNQMKQQSAQHIQRHYRGYSTRREIREREAVTMAEKSLSAQKLQSLHRGRAARRQVVQIRVDQGLTAEAALEVGRKNNYETKNAEVLIIQADNNEQEKILKPIPTLLSSRINTTTTTNNNTDAIAIDDNPINHAAAGKVQALHRGKLARKQVTKLKMSEQERHLVLEEVQHSIIERDMTLASTVKTIFGRGNIIALPRKLDRIIKVELSEWKLANGKSPLLFTLPDQLVAKRRVRTTMGKGWIINVRSDGFYNIKLDWTLAGGKRADYICQESKLEFVETEASFPEDILQHNGTVQDRVEREIQNVLEEETVVAGQLQHDKTMHEQNFGAKHHESAIILQALHRGCSAREEVKNIQEKSEVQADKQVHVQTCERAKKLGVLKKSATFEHITNEQHAAIVDKMFLEKIGEGTNVFVAGDSADAMFLLMKGTCSVTVNGKEVAPLKELDIFGESALSGTGDGVRTASVLATTEVQLLKLMKEDFVLLDLRVAETVQEMETLNSSTEKQNELRSTSATT